MADNDDLMICDESIITFMSTTAATSEVAKNYLQLADGDVDKAVILFFESGGEFSSQNASTSINPEPSLPNPAFSRRQNEMNEDAYADSEDTVGVNRSSFQRRLPQRDEYRAPIAPRREILTGGRGFEAHHIFDPEFGIGPNSNIMRSIAVGGPVTRSIVDPFRDYDREAAVVRGNDVAPATDRTERLADMFRPPFEIMWRSSVQAARDKANQDKKWIMITLQDPTEFVTQTQNRDLWSQEAVKDLVKENFIFILLTSGSTAGQEHRQFYPFENYPYIAILDPVTMGRIKMWSNSLDPDEFIVEVMNFVESGGALQANPKKKKKPINELSEEEQLEAALRASLGQSPFEEEEENKKKESRIGKERDEINDQKAATSTSIPVVATRENGDARAVFDSIQAIRREEPSTGDVTKVQIRCPNGERVVRKFRKSEPIRHIFEYVKSFIPGGDQSFELFNVRDPLSKKLSQSLQEANCVSAALTMDFV